MPEQVVSDGTSALKYSLQNKPIEDNAHVTKVGKAEQTGRIRAGSPIKNQSRSDESAVGFSQASSPSPSPQATKVFVSYSHKDTAWLERFLTALAPLVRREKIDIWADTRIKLGEQWNVEIDKAMNEARIALFLVSPAFFSF